MDLVEAIYKSLLIFSIMGFVVILISFILSKVNKKNKEHPYKKHLKTHSSSRKKASRSSGKSVSRQVSSRSAEQNKNTKKRYQNSSVNPKKLKVVSKRRLIILNDENRDKEPRSESTKDISVDMRKIINKQFKETRNESVLKKRSNEVYDQYSHEEDEEFFRLKTDPK